MKPRLSLLLTSALWLYIIIATALLSLRYNQQYDWTANTVTSSVGGIITAILGITFWIIKTKCKHMSSSCNSGCFKCSAREDTARTRRDAQFMKEFEEIKTRSSKLINLSIL